jgi:cytochrome c-type biogenesis protein CcsB
MKKIFATLLALSFVGQISAADLDFAPLKSVAVQHDGRKKPLDTLAVDTIQKLTGKRIFTDEHGKTWEPMDFLVALWLHTRDWEKEKIILVSFAPLKQRLGLPVERKYFSYEEIASPEFVAMLEPVHEKLDRGADLTRDERELTVIEQRLQLLVNTVGLDGLKLVPHPRDSKGRWLAVTQTGEYYPDEAARLDETLNALGMAYVTRNPEVFSTASHHFAQQLRALSPDVYPTHAQLQREVRYNTFHPFQKAWWLYAVAFIAMLGARKFRPLFGVSLAFFAAGFVIQAYAFYLRITISGRPPVTNMYESVVWVSFGVALFALILESIYRQGWYVLGAAPLSVIMLVLADQFPAVLDPSIGPLVPVLRDNFWLSVHVPTICLGYAALALSMGVGHIVLGAYLFAPQRRERLENLHLLLYRSLQIGVLLLTAGTILGGIWAHYAWGRFWGWDPKETWALIALLCYLVPLHGRLAGWMGNFALAAASVVCFLSVLMAWYGVNFVLGKGLHSYGFGVGGFGYVLGFVGLELAFVGLAALRRSAATSV